MNHVLTATDAGTETVPRALARVVEGRVEVEIGGVKLAFPTEFIGGEITRHGQTTRLAEAIQ